MKYIFKEQKSEYDKYIFSYQVLGLVESNDNLDDIYNQGFLLSRSTEHDVYLARSLRINLHDFSLNSENRRILSKTTSLEIEDKALQSFPYTYEIGKIALDYYKKKFDKNIMSAQTLKRIFTNSKFTNVLIFNEIGYCPILETSNIIHYAYPFYKNELIGKNIGMGMMIKAIMYAQETGKQYIYLGTAYTKESTYKLQFNGLEWFDGSEWKKDIDQLKNLIQNA